MDRRNCIHWFVLVLVAIATLAPGTARAADAQVRFGVGNGVTAEDEATARAGIELARGYIADRFGAELEGDLDVNVRAAEEPTNPYIIAYAGGDELVVFTESIGWQSLSPALRMQVIVHEYTHVFQRDELGYDEDVSPLWLIEGMAELVGFDALQSIGALDRRDVVGEQSRIVTIAQDDLPDLADIAGIEEFQSSDAPVYPLSYLAVRQLIGDPSDGRLQDYLGLIDGGMSWRRAFPRAFGLSLSDFYDDFAGWLGEDLVAPRRQPAAFRVPAPEKREADVAIGAAPETVEPGEQFAVVAATEPDAVCRFDLKNEAGDRIDTLRTASDPAGRVFWLEALPADAAAGNVTVTVNCGGQRDRIAFAVDG